MIILNRLDGSEFVLNSDLIETIEMSPDTVVALSGGKKIVVSQTKEEVVNLVVEFKRRCLNFKS